MDLTQQLSSATQVRHKPDAPVTMIWHLWRLAGRFYWARRVLGKFFGLRDGFRGQIVQSTLFPLTNIDHALDALHTDAVAFGLDLPAERVAAIAEFAHHTELTQENYADRSFSYADIQQGTFADGAAIPIAYAKNARLCPDIMAIVNDPLILEIGARYLGYRPKYFRDRLWFSFTGAHDLALRRQMNQTVDFHFDLPGNQFTFFYVSFYLTDVDAQSGAHTMIKGSHRNKPLWFKLGSSRRSTQALENVYGKNFDTLIEGHAGTGFFEDASCYHRALAPQARDRLMLQIRYF